MNAIDRIRPTTHPLDAMIKAPDHHFVLLENGKVRVPDTKVEPGQCTPIGPHFAENVGSTVLDFVAAEIKDQDLRAVR